MRVLLAMNKDSQVTSAPEERGRLVIAGWTLHEARYRLERDDQSVKLEPKTTELLGYLARHAGEPLSREQLLREVWPDVVVSDEALTNAVNKIRRAFGDDRRNPEVIETIPKMGYRLIASVEHSAIEEAAGYGTVRPTPTHATSGEPDSGGKANRKLAVILYADVAGYSRLMREDEEETYRRLSEYLDAFTAEIQNHHGKVVHFAGDAILAEFPKVSNALTCAASVQHELAERNEGLADERKVQFRIGV